MAAPGVAARTAAWRTVRRVHEGGAWSAPALSRELDRSDLEGRDRAFAANLAYETLRWEGTLDWALSGVVDRPLDRTDARVLDVLRLGAWQLLFGAVPASAAVDTAVDLVRVEVGDWASGFTNGALRALARRVEAGLPWPDDRADEGLAVRLGYPHWAVAEARARFGDRAAAVLAAGNDPPGVTLRAVGDRGALLDELRALGLDARPGVHTPEAVRVPGAVPGRLTAVSEGRAVVQDEASMLVARTVTAATGGAEPLVLDACAGPGGKTGHLAQLGCSVVAGDLQPARARAVSAAAERIGFADRVHVAAADAAAPPWRGGVFDAVLVDAPCTGLGVTRRRPELRWRRAAGDADRLGELQLRMLEAAVELLRPAGVLVYSVCTWTIAETEAVARGLLAAHGDRLERVDARALLPAARAGARDPGVQLDPDRHGVDGMYVAVFRRGSGGTAV